MFHSRLQALDVDRYRSFTVGATVLEADSFGDKVLHLADGTMLKLFRRKRLLSSALFYPYVCRFVDNIQGLQARGIACPQVINAYRIAAIARDAVHYRPLAGETLRRIIAGGGGKLTRLNWRKNWENSSPVCTKMASISVPCTSAMWC